MLDLAKFGWGNFFFLPSTVEEMIQEQGLEIYFFPIDVNPILVETFSLRLPYSQNKVEDFLNEADKLGFWLHWKFQMKPINISLKNERNIFHLLRKKRVLGDN
jgi:phosphosulfolactate synthase (CoM biosynthesis protein A)